MKIKYMGKYNGDPESMPNREHMKDCVKFKEFDSMKKLALVANIIALVLLVPLFALLYLRGGLRAFNFFGAIFFFITLLPHEFLHAVCFKEDSYIYTNLKQGLLFVFGAENMSKSRFIFMSLLPNLVFGFIPFILFMIFPNLTFLGTLGAVSIPCGAGDYMNVFNALTQVPKGAKIYMHGINSYWFMPDNTEENNNVN